MRNARVLGLLVCLITPSEAFAWGDDGHKTVALIAQQCLPPPVRKQITAMLAADTAPLTKHDFASAATWADKYRDSNHRKDHYKHTQNWHYVDMEIDHPDLDAACFGRPALPAGVLATDGPDQVCAIDKIKQFEAELTASSTDAEERLMALKFILHFVGDIHQPLHSSDNHDRGGNSVKVIVAGFPHTSKDELHGFFDTQFVDAIDKPPSALAKSLLKEIKPAQAKQWATGSPEDWQKEAFDIAVSDVYGSPPLSANNVQHLDVRYVDKAEKDIKLQLSRAGIRLAFLLDKDLGSDQIDWDTCLASAKLKEIKTGKVRRHH
jgi:hypothetical protein